MSKGKKGEKKKSGQDGAVQAPKPARRSGGMKPLRLGVLAATVISGPPLYRLVQQGSLDSVAAIEKAGIVALACAIGVSWLRGLVLDYQADVELTRKQRAARTTEILRMIDEESIAREESPRPPHDRR